MPKPVDFVAMGFVGTFALLYLSFGGYVVYTQLHYYMKDQEQLKKIFEQIDVNDQTKLYLQNRETLVTVNLDDTTEQMLTIKTVASHSWEFSNYIIKKRNYYYSKEKITGYDTIFITYNDSFNNVEFIIRRYNNNHIDPLNSYSTFKPEFKISRKIFDELEQTLKRYSINANPLDTSEEPRTLLGTPEEALGTPEEALGTPEEHKKSSGTSEGGKTKIGGTRAHRRRRVKRKSLTHKKVVAKRS